MPAASRISTASSTNRRRRSRHAVAGAAQSSRRNGDRRMRWQAGALPVVSVGATP
jgi:hypothetical protein